MKPVRAAPERLSNGDENTIGIRVENRYAFPVAMEIIDELPFQFQKRDFLIRTVVASGKMRDVSYTVRPVERGEYHFGALNIFAASPFNLAVRRYRFSADIVIPVYPSIIQMKKYRPVRRIEPSGGNGDKKDPADRSIHGI